jgi:hypothetical protein
MRRETIFGRSLCLQGSPLTLLIFKQEFSGDPLAHDGNFEAQISDLLNSEEDENGETVFFINTLGLLRVAWAMAKTYDKKTPNFEAWLEDFDEAAFDMRDAEELSQFVDAVINKEIFVFERPYEYEPDEDEEGDGLDDKWNVYKHILILKRAGFSMDEIRELTMSDFIALADIYAGKRDDDDEKPKVREATQADIDKLFPC